MNENLIQLQIQSLEMQLASRLDKLWKIFTWTSSIFVAITGGLVYISIDNQLGPLKFNQCIIISIVILTLVVYAYLWVGENLIFEGKIRDELQRIYTETVKNESVYKLRPDKAKFGYRMVIILLGGTSFFATWLDFFSKLGTMSF